MINWLNSYLLPIYIFFNLRVLLIYFIRVFVSGKLEKLMSLCAGGGGSRKFARVHVVFLFL